jgi:hypothetical protein
MLRFLSGCPVGRILATGPIFLPRTLLEITCVAQNVFTKSYVITLAKYMLKFFCFLGYSQTQEQSCTIEAKDFYCLLSLFMGSNRFATLIDTKMCIATH